MCPFDSPQWVPISSLLKHMVYLLPFLVILATKRWGIFDRFLNFDNCQPEVVSDIISGVVVRPDGCEGSCKIWLLYMSNRSRDIRLRHFVRTTTTADGPYDNRVRRFA